MKRFLARLLRRMADRLHPYEPPMTMEELHADLNRRRRKALDELAVEATGKTGKTGKT